MVRGIDTVISGVDVGADVSVVVVRMVLSGMVVGGSSVSCGVGVPGIVRCSCRINFRFVSCLSTFFAMFVSICR